MKKRFVTVLLSLCLLLSLFSTSAMAEGALTLPDLASCSPDTVTLAASEDGVYLYTAADAATAMTAIVTHAAALTNYGFDNLAKDLESSDMFYYFYMSTYNGTANIKPELINDCPTPAYVLYGLTGYDKGVVICMKAAEGVNFTTNSKPAATYPEPIVGANGRLIKAPEEYLNLLPISGLSVDKGWYMYIYTGQRSDFRSQFLKYKDDLLTSGYYELLDYEPSDGVMEIYTLGYTGPDEVENFWNFKKYGSILIEFYGDDTVWLCVSNDIAMNNLEKMAEKYLGYEPDTDATSTTRTKTEYPCPKCGGRKTMECPSCNNGYIPDPSTSLGKQMCPRCSMRGRVTCDSCNGSGKMN